MHDTDALPNPFPGLRSFEADEVHLFFGRESRIDEILTRLRRSRFLTVLGTSGSGKSSIIRSGLLPSLYSGMMAKAGSSWRIAIFRPGEDPIGNLADALNAPDVLGPEDGREENRGFIEATLRRSSRGLVDCIRQSRLPAYDNVLIVVDQFEELFRFKSSRQLRDSHDEAVAFVQLLLTAVQQQEVPIYVVTTMRSDFIGNCTEFEGLTDAINEGQYLVPRMNREERRSAITGPVAVGGAEITPRLVLRLLNDVGDDPDQLPILQHAMMRTWEYWAAHHVDGEPIDLQHYEAIGTMTQALSRHAEEAYLELETPAARQIAERMFKALTDRGSDARGVRSPRRLEELCALTGATEAEVIAVIDVFRRPGRSFLMPPADVPLTAGSVIDISHESLMRIWTRLIQWTDEEARSAQMYLRISRAAQQHQEGQAGLLRDPELQLALNWRHETQPTVAWAARYDPAFERAMLFLEESERQRDRELQEKERQRIRQLRWTRRLAIILGSAAVITLAFGLYAMTLKVEADANLEEAITQKERAEEQHREAVRARLAADEQRTRAEQQTAIASEQRQRAEEQSRLAEQQTLAAEQQKALAEAERRRAESESLEAKRQREQAEAARAKEADAHRESERERSVAVAQRERAETLRVQAEAAESDARRMRLLAVARAVAVQTTRMTTAAQRELSALLAVHASQLHLANGGAADDAQVFDAVRTSLARLDPSTVQPIGTLQDAVRVVAVAPGGDRVAAAGDDGRIWLSDSTSRGATVKPQATAGREVRALAWAARGRMLAAGTLDGRVLLIDVGTANATPTVLVGPGPAITALAVAPNGNELAIAAGTSVWLRGPTTDAPPRTLSNPGGAIVTALAFLPDGRLAAATKSGVLVWTLDTPSDAPIHLLRDRPLRAIAAAGTRLAVGAEDGALLLGSTRNGGGFAQWSGHTAAITSLRFAGDGTRLASSSLDGTVRLWDVTRADHEPLVLSGHGGWVWAVDFAQDDQRLVSGGADRTLRTWPTQTAPLVAALCQRLTRGLTLEEWREVAPGDVPLEAACRPQTLSRRGATR